MEQYLTCNRCGKEFTHWNANKSYCDECSEIMKRERSRKSMQKKRAKKVSTQTKTIREVLQELTEYNKEHGTSLSYGQYVLIM